MQSMLETWSSLTINLMMRCWSSSASSPSTGENECGPLVPHKIYLSLKGCQPMSEWPALPNSGYNEVDIIESGDLQNYPRVGLWEKWYEGDHARTVYDDSTTAKVAAGFLNRPDISVIEDWGSGLGGF